MKEEMLDNRNYEEMNNALSTAEYTVYKRYIDDLKSYAVVTPDKILLAETAEECIRSLRLQRLTSIKGEDVSQKLSTIYSACMELGCTIFVMIDVPTNTSPAEIYLGVRNSDYKNKHKLSTSFLALKEGIQSHFPGTQIKEISPSQELGKQLDDIFSDSVKYISSVSTIASVRDKGKTENKSFIQGIEKLIDGMQGHVYTALLIAEPVAAETRGKIKKGYEELYSALAPFRKSVWSYNENDSRSVMHSLSNGISKSITNGVNHTQSHTISKTKSIGNTVNIGLNGGISSSNGLTISKTRPTTVAKVGQVAGVAGGVLKVASPLLAATPLGPVAAGAGVVLGAAGNIMQGATKSTSVAEMIGKSLGIQAGFAHSVINSYAEGEQIGGGSHHEKTKTENKIKVEGNTETRSTGRTLQIENVNMSIEEMLKKIEKHLERMNELDDFGAYNCGAYFLSAKQENSILAANTYQALMRGEGTGIEASAVNCWTDENVVAVLKDYLKRMEHPVFALPYVNDEDYAVGYMSYSAGTIVSGQELPLHLGLPSKSVEGLPVIEHAEFGRNVECYNDGITIGRLSNRGVTTDRKVQLDVQSLSSHCFITGSTGSGKSNTVYQLLKELKEKEKKFLVIEPAKGEYAQAFGGMDDVTVYGTNPLKIPNLLQLNPFSFEQDIHVLEHMDRLVEIFNACWPMYAAMPAILKEAMENAYIEKGWDLSSSTSMSGEFPTFLDVVDNLRRVIDKSDYSGDTKGDYKGALVTRVKSLTTGLYGQILCSGKEISAEKLFDENVIIDLSRIGSAETKTLLMGILILKLQEYRMAHSKSANEVLRHVTVLEEAHNLLRRCESITSQEAGNLRGLAVEMISNAIAEMRTYGEGFMIVDQAPGLLDMAVIRNTNTKIIMRLPDEEDRKLVGKAASLNDDQIIELARLKKGVAAIYQNEWIEPVLCEFDEYKEKQPLEFVPRPITNILERYFEIVCGFKRISELNQEEIDSVHCWINGLKKSANTKKALCCVLEGACLGEEELQKLLYNVFGGKQIAKELARNMDEIKGIEFVDWKIQTLFRSKNKFLIETIRNKILRIILSASGQEKITKRYSEYVEYKGGIV